MNLHTIVSEDPEHVRSNDLHLVARRSLLNLLEPLAGFALDSGVSTREFNSMFREATVRSAAAKQLEASERVNISGIAAATGIPRAEVSKILRRGPEKIDATFDHRTQSTNRILSAWYEDPRFTRPDGQPAELKLYGKGATFEALAKRYARGLPTRAILDELVRAGAIEMLENQKIRAKAAVAVDRGVSLKAMKSFGDRAAELLSTMLSNIRYPGFPKFIANVSETSIPASSLPFLRNQVSLKGADFLADIQESIGAASVAASSKQRSRSARISVTVYYHESLRQRQSGTSAKLKRRNFRREY